MRTRNIWLGLVVLLFPIWAFSQPFQNRTGGWMLGGGIGINEDPSLVALRLNVDYYITDEISVGPLAQYGFRDDDYIFGLSGVVKYSAILAQNKVVRPYGELGIGYIEFDCQDLFDGKRKTTYLFPVGGGFEFKLTDHLALDVNILFNLSKEIFLSLIVGVNYIF